MLQNNTFTILTENNNTWYNITCKCGKTSEGTLEYLPKLIEEYIALKQVGCKSCLNKLKEENLYKNKLNQYNLQYQEYLNKNTFYTLSLEETIVLLEQNCHYCDQPSEFIGIKEQSKGYIVSNVIPQCFKCLHLKKDMSHSQFVERLSNDKKWELHRPDSQESYLSSDKEMGDTLTSNVEGKDMVESYR